MATVITYQHAYVGGTTTLCEEHAASPPDWVPSLGPVSHGAHQGGCEACSDDHDEATRRPVTHAVVERPIGRLIECPDVRILATLTDDQFAALRARESRIGGSMCVLPIYYAGDQQRPPRTGETYRTWRDVSTVYVMAER